MTMTPRERNMRRILLVFALVCLLLTVYLFIDGQQLARELQMVTSASRGVERVSSEDGDLVPLAHERAR